MVVILNDWKNGSVVGQYGIHLIASHFGIFVGNSVAMFNVEL
jgi:hypothetical protein